MNELLLWQIAGALSVLVLAVIAIWCNRLNPENLSKYESWPRNRLVGLLLGWVELAICVPHAMVISPNCLQPLLWPLAVIIPVLCYFYIDYATARAVGGAMILWSYYLIHKGFDLHTPMLAIPAVLGWVFGLAGIWVSGKPCSLRDWIRLCSKSTYWRRISTSYLLLLAVLVLIAVIMTKGR